MATGHQLCNFQNRHESLKSVHRSHVQQRINAIPQAAEQGLDVNSRTTNAGRPRKQSKAKLAQDDEPQHLGDDSACENICLSQSWVYIYILQDGDVGLLLHKVSKSTPSLCPSRIHDLRLTKLVKTSSSHHQEFHQRSIDGQEDSKGFGVRRPD